MRTLDDRIADEAAANDNIIDRPRLMVLGATDRMIATWVRRRVVQQLQQGVYLVGAAAPSWLQLARSGVRAGGPDAVLAGRAAPRLWGLDGATSDAIEVLVPHSKGPRPGGVKVHRTTRPIARRYRDGIPVTDVETTLLNYAGAASEPLVERAVESALLKRLTTEKRIWLAIAANSGPGMRGVAPLRRVMERRPEGKPARSVLELIVLDVLRAAGLPLPHRNYDVKVDGKVVAEIDLAYLAKLVALECDGKAFHSTTRQREKDKRRQARLEQLGWRFLRVTWFDVMHRPEWIVEQVRSLLSATAAA